MKTGAIILATNHSSDTGQCKPLLKVGEKTMLDHCIHLFQNTCVDEIIIVTGHKTEKIQKNIKKETNMRVVENPDIQGSMFSSIRRGVQALQNCNAFFVHPVNIPLVRPSTLAALIKGFDGDKSVLPVFDGSSGHPLLIAGNLRETILQTGDNGILHHLLIARSYKEVEVWDAAILSDANTPKAYTELCDAAERRDILLPREAEIFAAQYMPRQALRHCQSVAAMAVELAEALPKGSIDLDLIYGAALLHNIGYGQPGHAAAGAEIMYGLGLQKIAEIIATYEDMAPPADGKLTEREIVCLADKMIDGSERVSLRTRFEKELLTHNDKDASYTIARRLHNAEGLAALWEKATGKKLN